MSLQDFAEWQRQEAITEYLSGQRPASAIDSYSDEEIVAYDFIQRFGEDMSDEEIDEEINRLKADPEAFEKRVALLRNAFKSEEEAQAKLYQDQEAARNAENEQMFINTYAQALSNIDSIQNIELDSQDRDELLRFVLEKDQANRTGLSKAMDDPEKVLKMAWYLLHGEETVDAMIDYFQKEISKRTKQGNPRVVKTTRKTVPQDDFVF
jgi:multidrug efflux pump subunit AcrB